jgi:membrane fusion protein, macrolide-specific efflux system
MKLIKIIKLKSMQFFKWFKTISIIKKVIITGVIILLIWFIAGRILATKTSTAQYQTATVQKGTLISTISESGNIASISQAAIGSPTNGVITDIFVKNGDEVSTGQELFKVKSTASAQEIASAWSSYLNTINSVNSAVTSQITSQATLEKDRVAVINASSAVTTMQNNINAGKSNPATSEQYKRDEIDVINSGLTSSKETFSADEQKYLQTNQNIAAAKASQTSAYLSYQATQDSAVTAPIDGTVANISVHVGDQVSASGGNLSSNLSSSTNPSGNVIMAIGNYSTPYIKVSVSEVDVPNIKAGQKATITLDAFSSKTYVGKVSGVDTVGTMSSGVVTYNAYIDFLYPPSSINPGMTVTVTIQTARKDNVLYVPSAAIQTTNGQSYVRILKNGSINQVDVVTGISSDSDIEVDSGLSEGDTVVTSVTSSTTTSTTSSSPFSGLGGRGLGGGFSQGSQLRTGGR